MASENQSSSIVGKYLPPCIPKLLKPCNQLQWSNMVMPEWRDQCTFLFSIFNFNKDNLGHCIHSPIFTFENNKNIKWKLVVNLGNTIEEYYKDDCLYINLCRISPEENIEVNYTLSLLDCHDQEVKKADFYGPGKKTWSGDQVRHAVIKFNNLFNRKETLLPGDRLQILCSIWWANKGHTIEASSGTIEIQKKSIVKPTLHWMKDLLDEEELKDITFSVNGQVIKAHKCVLAVCSPVFAAMLKNDMKEKNTGRIEVTDASLEAITEMLRFLYTGEVENAENVVEKLLPVAEKYQLLDLRNWCEQYLRSSINVQNVCRRLELSNLFELPSLQIEAMNLITTQRNEVRKTNEYKSLVKRNPTLILEIFCLLDDDKNEEPTSKKPKT